MEDPHRIKVIIADDHEMFLEGIVALLSTEPDIEIQGKARDGRTALDLCINNEVDVAILDYSMPILNGLMAAELILKNSPSVKIIGLSMHNDIQIATEMLKVGCKGYVLKESSYHDLILAIRYVFTNRLYIQPEISRLLLDYYIDSKSTESSSPIFSLLSSREREVLQLLAEGNSSKEIASFLNISSKTVDCHRQRIMDKLNIFNIAELTKFAIREKITTLNT